jgi:membrane fusion protein, heavy metal efflux system
MPPLRLSPLQIVFCAAAALCCTGCGKHEAASAEEKPAASQARTATGEVSLGPDAPELKQMSIEPVKTVSVPADEVIAPAKIEVNPNQVGHAVLPVPGRIMNVMTKLGDSVAKGQPLFTLESTVIAEAESGYVQAQSSVRQAELALAKAEADAARMNDLYEHQAVAQKEALAARTAEALSRSSLEQAQTAREQARRRLELLGLKAGKFQQQMTVTAPISGKVLEVSVVSGEFRNEINTPLITVANLSRVWATSDVPESQIRFYKLGGTADLELLAFPGQMFKGRVTRIADTVNSETRTIKVTAELDNPGGQLRPEMYGRLRYADGMVSAPWIPEGAVIRGSDKEIVFVELSRGRFLSTPVKLGRAQGGGFAVSSGLKPGDRVVTKGSIYLKSAL